MNIYDFELTTINNQKIKMQQYKNKVIIIVNTASKCGFTPQFKELEQLYQKYKDKGLIILGFPCNQFKKQDPESNEKIMEFCALNYGVTFDMFAKIDVNGKNEHPLYKFLKEQTKNTFGSAIKWNFTKFLIDKKGNIIERFSPNISPVKMESKIVSLLNEIGD